jgi:hypothetical protein
MDQTTQDADAASVSMGSLDMTGDQQTTSDGYVNDITATVSGSWQYELPGGAPSTWVVALRVSDGDSWYPVGSTSGDAEYKQYNDFYTVSGSIIETEAFTTETFAAPGPGRQITADLPLQIWFRVLDTNEQPLASTKATDTATVTVGQEAIDASLYGEVSGEGAVEIS